MQSTSPLQTGIEYGFFDSNVAVDENYRPSLLVNDASKGSKVLTTILRELEKCDEFLFSVAFVTEGGVVVLLETLKMLQAKGVKGKIVASQYQNFTQPKALKRLLEFDNIELRIVTNDDYSMHTKGYIFRHGEEYVSIIGSSNLTQTALCENQEWNVKLISAKDGGLTKNTIEEFYRLFNEAVPVDGEFLSNYQRIYDADWELEKVYRKAREEYEESIDLSDLGRVKPNRMQNAALTSLSKLREAGKDKALLVSATGTGKTYLAAFDVATVNPDRCLFIIHREQIAKEALRSFRNVLGNKKKMSVLSGTNKDLDADYIFSTIQTLSKDSTINQIPPEAFDYVVVDEVHRAGAPSYQKVLDYLKPKFILGMTATPERSDDFDIFKMFDHNIAYEIRLQDAMREKLICPFHYFGITELTVDGEVFDDTTEFRHLVADNRVNHIIHEAEFYGYDGDRVKGLVFCSRNEEAKELSEKFNARGYNTVALSGADSQEAREAACDRLEQETREGGLDYIFTVDIFNEGVDIPSVNQIIMLRPTQSAIIFVQQLGRGLRKFQDKEFVVIIDFIGNYTKNFLIPIALSGDRTYNKDTIRKYVGGGSAIIPGCSTIHFDEITRQRIYESIDSANFNDIKLIKEGYKQLKYKLGRIPTLMDFDEHGEIDPLRIIDNKSLGSYYAFLSKYEKDYTPRLNEVQKNMLDYISRKFASGKRPGDLLVLKNLLNHPADDQLAFVRAELADSYDHILTEDEQINLFNVLTNKFSVSQEAKKYANCIFLAERDGQWHISNEFEKELRTPEFKRLVAETVEFGLYRNRRDYSDTYKQTAFQLYSKYTYQEICRLLNWRTDIVSLNIGGYKYDDTTKTYPVFINYDKAEDITDTTKYEDRLLSPSRLIAISKSKRDVNSPDVQNAVHADERGITMHLFVRKNKDDKISKEFYYLGQMHATGKTKQFIMPNTDNISAVEIEYTLEVPVREDLYRYITDGEDGNAKEIAQKVKVTVKRK